MITIPGSWEWLIIVAIAVLVFGRKLPGIMRSLGSSCGEFKKGFKGVEEEIKDVKDLKKDIDNITHFKIS
ncbi:MAG: twin-arginine translocase TatA/TatE family subunit [Candidatus Brocadiaceae bacterium]|nr:twin-arginine translocase TatA/TatE family subunit [Candidatus Brocadiaceae bacterium]